MTGPTAASGSPMRCLSVSLIAMVTVAVAGGGGSSGDAASTSAERLAVRGDMTRVCPEKRSRSIPMKVTNQLDTPVQFYFSEIDCFDWGGTTPAASSGMILPAGNAHSVLMEPDTFAVLPASLVGGKPAKAVIGAGDTLVLRYNT